MSDTKQARITDVQIVQVSGEPVYVSCPERHTLTITAIGK
jgi:hypothetical protein